jgi:hypothetical protein
VVGDAHLPNCCLNGDLRNSGDALTFLDGHYNSMIDRSGSKSLIRSSPISVAGSPRPAGRPVNAGRIRHVPK